MRNTFRVYERLKREQHIHTLFLKGKAFSVFPVRFIYQTVLLERGSKQTGAFCALQAGFSVPKKKFRSSVDRHEVRRKLVESWRLNKQVLIDAVPADRQLHVFLVYTGKELPTTEQVLPAVITGIARLKAIMEAPTKTADTTESTPPQA